jgi:hypothetical protein
MKFVNIVNMGKEENQLYLWNGGGESEEIVRRLIKPGGGYEKGTQHMLSK